MATENPLDPAAPDAPANPDTTPEKTSKEQPDTDWKQRYSDLRKDYDRISSDTKPEKVEEPKKDSKDPNDDTLWLIDHAAELKIVKEEFSGYAKKGYSREDALRLAKLDKGVVETKSDSRASVSSAPSITNRSGNDEEVFLSETDKAFGINPETKRKYRDLVEGE